MIAPAAKVGMRVRQHDWLLRPTGYRDGTVRGLLEFVKGTDHRWLSVEFPGHITGRPLLLTVSTAQLTDTLLIVAAEEGERA